MGGLVEASSGIEACHLVGLEHMYGSLHTQELCAPSTGDI